MVNVGSPITAYLGLGSNLDNPQQQIELALRELVNVPNTRLMRSSSLYRTPPMGPPDQPDYINAVAEIATMLSPESLLDELQRIEMAHHRVRSVHWGPRTLDFDILLYGHETITTPRLTVPHPGLAQRPFVVFPLAEIAPGLHIPGLGDIARLCAALSNEEPTRL
jgi:2-amino-4-hydroxy-6-hydroxymethyldihydropteridine diphosphokinase